MFLPGRPRRSAALGQEAVMRTVGIYNPKRPVKLVILFVDESPRVEDLRPNEI